MFSGDVPFNSSALPPLEALSLGYNQLGGQIDEALILKFTNLTWLHLSYNNFSSEWELDTLLSSLTNLYALELSYSGLSLTTTGNVTHNASPNFQMLSLASCKIKEFPESLRSMRYLEWLDLSNNEIHGDIPIWAGEIGGDSRLLHLHLQSNQIKGPSLSSICNMSNLYWLDLSNNNFGGVIPQCFGNITSSLSILNLNSNQFQGPVRSSICNRSNFYSLDLSNNSFDGVIPQCFGNLSSPLFMMDLGNNDFHGTIPDMFDDCKNLQGLILNGNQLHGELPASLSRCHFLKVLDLENNHLNGTFPNWLGNLSKLQVLNLKSNMFYGDIATSSIVDSPFPSLRVLDLSHNRFVGQLPAIYFENFSAMKNVVRSSTIPKYLNIMGIKDYSIDISVKGMVQDFPQIFVEYTIVCLSNNSFEGKIPDIIGSLNSLKVLDLSHNSLTGLIPQDLGKLSEIESLDLSWNQLTGEIPQSLAELTGLGFLNLSQNHLMGRIPAGTQFTTFGNSFRGNLNLCGLPLPKKCNENQQESHLDDDGDEEENGFTWKVVMLGYGCGTLFGLVMGYLMLSTGRPKWFNAIADEAERMILTRRKKRRYITYIGR